MNLMMYVVKKFVRNHVKSRVKSRYKYVIKFVKKMNKYIYYDRLRDKFLAISCERFREQSRIHS